MPEEPSVFNIWTSFQSGDLICHYRVDYGRQKHDVVCIPGSGCGKFVKTIGICAEPIFFESFPESTRRLAIVGPEIRLYDEREKVHGPCVGFVSSYKGERTKLIKRRNGFLRMIDRLYGADKVVMAIFVVVLLLLGAAIGLGIGAAVFLP